MKAVERAEAGLWRIRVKPDSWRDVAVTLAGGRNCDTEGAVCAADGRMLSNTARATTGGPVRLRVKGGKAREGKDAAIGFAVSLNRAASDGVSVDYATADGTATAGEDYTHAEGTLEFAPGETEKTVSVAILDDAIDEGKEIFVLRLSNPRGAYLRSMHREAKGVIVNDDHMPQAWIARFGRTVTGHVLEARLAAPRTAGASAALAGQALPEWTGGTAAAADDNNAPDRTASLADDREAMDAMRRWVARAGTGRQSNARYRRRLRCGRNAASPVPRTHRAGLADRRNIF